MSRVVVAVGKEYGNSDNEYEEEVLTMMKKKHNKSSGATFLVEQFFLPLEPRLEYCISCKLVAVGPWNTIK